MRISWIVMVLCGVLPTAAQGVGTFEYVFPYSSSLGFTVSTIVYMPDGYDPDGAERYPVIHFLHGANYNHSTFWSYFNMKSSLDALIGFGDIEPLIFVMPNGDYGEYGGCYWTNSSLYGLWEDFVTQDLVEYIDDHYRTLPTRYFRCIQGLSMGGYGAMKCGLKHRDTYVGIVAQSGPLDFRTAVPLQRPLVLAEYPAGPPYDYDPSAGFWSGLFFTRSGAFSPNLDNPPWYVDFPLDEEGEIVESVMLRWDLNNPPRLAAQLPPHPWPLERETAIYFECGTNDEHLEYPVNQAFAESLAALGIPYTFRSFVGGHTSHFSQRFPMGVAYLDSVMQTPMFQDGEGPRDEAPPGQDLWIEEQNPCSGAVTIGFRLPVEDWVNLTVFDAQGRSVRRLLDEPQAAGQHRCLWRGLDDEGSSVSRGVYFLSLRSGHGLQGRERVVVIR